MKKQIIDTIDKALSDYESAFSCALSEEEENEWVATVTYKFGELSRSPKHEFYFDCHIIGGVCLMDFGDGCWYEITEENLFKFMFFVQTQRMEESR